MKTKIRRLLPFHRLAALVALLTLVLLRMTDFAGAQAVTQGYNSDESLQRGMIVQVKESDTTKVEPVSKETADRAHGVVVNPNDAPVTVSAEGQKVFVATTGKYEVLVSDQNGVIKAGEYITISAIKGIGMKVDDRQPVVVGKALADFDGKSGVIGTAKIQDKTVNIGRVMTDITVAGNPLQKVPPLNLPEFLRKAAESVAQKPVNTSRIYLSLVIFFLSAIVSGSLFYIGVRSGITSLGRNPLSKKSIIRGMMQVIIVGLIIFISGIFGVYLLLKL